MQDLSSLKTKNSYVFIIFMAIIAQISQCQPQPTDPNMVTQSENDSSVTDPSGIYGVRWSLGDYFAYQNLYKLHEDYPNHTKYPANTNYYVLAFNSFGKISGDVFVKIGETPHTCSHREIQIQNSDDHDPIQVKLNSTLNSTYFHLYRCHINTDFTMYAPVPEQQSSSSSNRVYYQYSYTIFSRQPQFLLNKRQQVDNNTLDRTVLTKQQILFSSTFRPPVCSHPMNQQQGDKKQKQKLQLNRNILVLGDWGIIDQKVQDTWHYIPVLQSLIKRVNQDKNLVLTIFLGDIGYDLIAEKYIEMLQYIQPITSRIVFMPTPGNHDYIYHQDSFQLFAETFLSPQSDKYYDFYYNFILDDTLFISYSPSNVLADQRVVMNVDSLTYIQQDLYNHYVHRLSSNPNTQQHKLGTVPGVPDPINKQYHVIVFSHYPIFCSKMDDRIQSCIKNKFRYKQFLNSFTDFGMDLHLAGHLHYYERTSGICWNKLYTNFTNDLPEDRRDEKQEGKDYSVEVYSEKCPIFLVEGAAGNSYFVEEDKGVTPAWYSQKVVGGTGFGVISIFEQQSSSKQLHYTHYKMINANKSERVDKMIKKLPKFQKKKQQKQSKTHPIFNDTDLRSARLWEMSGILALIFIGSLICFCYGRKFVKDFGHQQKRKDRGGHVEMVEQNFGPLSGVKHSSSVQSKQYENTQN